MKSCLFPLGFAFNSFSLSLLVVIAGVFGHHALAADLSLAQAAMIALFYGFSANARNLILKTGDENLVKSVVQMRLLTAPVLAAVALLVAVYLSKVPLAISFAIVVRQLSEWFSELELAQMEKARGYARARLYLAVFLLPLLVTIAALLFARPLFIPALYLWAAAPLFLCAGGIGRSASTLSSISIEWGKILPNYGSTFIIGIVVFFFRLLISGFSGKEVAGQLFTAFALGSIVGSLYERTIGPSFKVSSGLSAARTLLFRLSWVLPAAGAALVVAALLWGGADNYLGQNIYLAGAAGFSLVGGFVMLGAQVIKINILHSSTRDDVFMADLLSNFAILVSVPVVFLLFGETAFMLLLLTNSILVYAAYWLISRPQSAQMHPGLERAVQIVMAFAVVSPVFFQLGAGVYRGVQEIYDWGGSLSLLPLPLSVFLVFPLILMLHSFRNVKAFSVFTFFAFTILMCGTMVSSGGHGAEVRDKLFLSLQYLLPFFGLVLAEHAGTSNALFRRLAKVFFYVSASVAALQLGVSLYSGVPKIQPYLYLFSIYNNLQYASVILVSAYLFSVFALYRDESWRRRLLFLVPVMGLYTAFSGSISAAALLFAGLALFCAVSRSDRATGLVLVTGVLVFWGGAAYSGNFTFLNAAAEGRGSSLTRSFKDSWAMDVQGFYLRGIRNSDTKTFLFGHPTVPERKLYPSAHNYYLDIMYNFGAVTLLPVLLLIMFTLRLAWTKRSRLAGNPGLAGLGFIVFFLVLVENSFKVGLRQPYSGIYAYFLWGLFVAFLLADDGPGKTVEKI